METKAWIREEICPNRTIRVICGEVHARIPVSPVSPLMFHISDSHSNKRDMNQYSPIIFPAVFKISPYQNLICA